MIVYNLRLWLRRRNLVIFCESRHRPWEVAKADEFSSVKLSKPFGSVS